MRRDSLVHEFVDGIPTDLDEGTLYVSIRYRTAVHLCACGCGNKVVTPIKPARWHLSYNGETVSLSPSIGNWQFPCRSHYWIRDDGVCWAGPWTADEVEAGRDRDARQLGEYYEDRKRTQLAGSVAANGDGEGGRLFRRAWQWLRARVRGIGHRH